MFKNWKKLYLGHSQWGCNRFGQFLMIWGINDGAQVRTKYHTPPSQIQGPHTSY